MDNFEFLGPNLPKNGFWGRNFKNLSLHLESAPLRYCVHQFSDKTDTFEFLGPNLPKNGLWGQNFKSKSGFGINTSKIPCVPIFSQNGQLLVFRPKFGEIAQLRAIFWFKYCWGCCRQLGGGWNKLGGGEWSWLEVGTRFSNTYLIIKKVYTDTINPLQLFIFTDVIRCSRLPFWVGYFIYLKFTGVSSIVYHSLHLVQLKKQIG